MLIETRTGQLRLNVKARIDGLPTIIHAMDARAGQLALGTVNGRITVTPVDALLGADDAQGWVGDRLSHAALQACVPR
ncbi:hypothetical protein PUP68_19125 [Pseudomonas chlororaphis]|uniref:hypothetical protein n=1 Tax=Pseudomonas chlororaphis TaxID=587753 RepID=UPI00236883B9|nr:hypothetical protein [Pseudomonas chlororaphis]WDG77785.1 hypothetical protein PUP77_25735 [Pseudomonas chlororaphis]WDG82978.1 hypothetical protein PUP68_19125 [Pseudomonas chlororaphis]